MKAKWMMSVAMVLALMLLSCEKAEKVQLGFRLKAGESYGQTATVRQNISQTIQGQKQDMSQELKTKYVFDVEEVDAEGNVTGTVVYKAVSIMMDGPLVKVEYDSETPDSEAPSMARGFAALKGKSFSMKISPRGRVMEIGGAGEMVRQMLEGMEIPLEAMRKGIETQLAETFGDQAMKESMRNSMAIYPDYPVGIGDSWAEKFVMSKGFPMVIDNTWELDGRKGGLAVIKVKSDISSNPDAESMNLGGMTLKYDVSGGQQGSMEVDEATGWIDYADITQKMSGEVKVEGGPMPRDMSWPISIESNVTMVRDRAAQGE
jgi:hypothetical protein